MRSEKNWTWFVIAVILITGSFLLVVTPMGANYDEETHVARIWEMSLGHLIPNSLYSTTDFFPAVFFDSSFRRNVNLPVIDFSTWKHQAGLKIDFNNYMRYTTRAVYFPTIYAIQAVLIGITGRLFDFPVLFIYYVLRFSYLLIYCAFVYLTLKVLPTGRHLFGIIALAPVAIIQSAAISADAFVFGISFLFTGWILHLLAEPSKALTRKQLIITCILILAIGTLKPNSIFLLALLFILPRSLHLTRSQKWTIVLTALASVAISAGWSVVTSQFFLEREDAGKDPLGQFSLLLKEPLQFVNLYLVSIKTGWWTLFMQSIGIAGYGYFVLPKFIYFLFPAVLVLSLFSDNSEFKLSWRQSLYFFAVALFNVFMIYVIFYIIETEVWAEEIKGIQGRYISPLSLLFFSGFLFLSRFKFKGVRYITAGATLMILFATAASLYLDYHVPCGRFWFTKEECTMPRYKNWDEPSFTSYSPSSITTIEEVMTPRCENLNSVSLWITNNSNNEGMPYTISLKDETQQVVRSLNANTLTTIKSGWMTYPFEVISGSVGKQYTVVITSDAVPSTDGIEFGAFSKNEFVDGYLQINGTSGGYAPDLVIQYGCEKFGQ